MRGLETVKDVDLHRLADLQARREAGDAVLRERLIDVLSVAVRRGTQRYEPPPRFDLPEHCMLWQWLEVFLKALQATDVRSWVARLQLDPGSVRIKGATLYVNAVQGGVTTPRVMTLDDDSGWWKVADPITLALQVIDPAGLEPEGIREPSRLRASGLSLRTALAFYGYPLPQNRPQAQVMLEELLRLPGLPVIGSDGHIVSDLLVEIAEQAQDCTLLAGELESMLHAQSATEGEYDFITMYKRRIRLESGSLLARNMRLALGFLQGLSIKLNVGRGARPSVYYFSALDGTLMEVSVESPPQKVASEKLAALDISSDFLQLKLLAQSLGTSVHPDGGFSFADLLRAYGHELPESVVAVRALIQSLRQAVGPDAPYVHESAHSVQALVRHRNYLGLLNNRYWAGLQLDNLSNGKEDAAVISTASVNVEVDGDSSLFALIAAGREALSAVMDLGEFQALASANTLDPKEHVLVTSGGYVGAYKLDGEWMDLDRIVNSNAVLAEQFKALTAFAQRIGGALRSNGVVTLEQVLKHYGFSRPVTVFEARVLAQRLNTAPLRPRYAQEYWNALGGVFASALSPLLSSRLQAMDEPEYFMPRGGWEIYHWRSQKRSDVTVVLNDAQRQQVRVATAGFMRGRNGTLFDLLATACVQGKTLEGVRAEADVLLVQMLASQTAQHLADVLTRAVAWSNEDALNVGTRASRHALVLAALILGFDPQACSSRNRIAGVDLADPQLWGGTCSSVLLRFERALADNHRISANAAPLAAHLLLSGIAPELLVRGTPDWVTYMSGHNWVYFKHCVGYLEGKFPGASRHLTFESLTSGDRLRRLDSKFFELPMFSGPVVDWARTHGVLPITGDEYTGAQAARAWGEWLRQYQWFLKANAFFDQQPVQRRSLALDDLLRVFPGNSDLESRVLARLPAQAQHAEAAEARYSMVDLHLCGELRPGTIRWYSTRQGLDFAQLSEQFNALTDINKAYGERFTAWDTELWSTYAAALQDSMALLPLAHRQRLEYGALTLSVVNQSIWGNGGRAKCGVLLLCQHPGAMDCAYEVFPRQLKIVPRPDLDVPQLLAASELSPSSTAGGQGVRTPVQVALDWAAYASGDLPRAGITSTVILERVGTMPAEVVPAQVGDGQERVPKTLTSPRINSLAQAIIGKSLFTDGFGLRLTAAYALRLDDALSGRDPWFDYARGVSCRQSMPG